MRMFVASLALCLAWPAHAENLSRLQPPDKGEALTDAAIIALLIAGSVAIYKATGRPCACPTDTTSNGQACGGRSAWSKPGGAKPLCIPTDITPDMIKAYRLTKAIPAVW